MRVDQRILYTAVLVAGLAAGCASGKGPFSLTGREPTPSQSEQARWTDDKGHYHPEWRKGINTPANYPKGSSQQQDQQS